MPDIPRDPAVRIEWPEYGGDPGGLKYSPARDISVDNVSRLRPLWTWGLGSRGRRTADDGTELTAGAFQATPVMVGDTLFFSTPFAGVVALDAATGRELWSHDPGGWRWPLPGGHSTFVHRGVALWSGPEGRRVFINSRWRLVALDAATGKPVRAFGDTGVVDLSTGLRWPVDPLHLNSTSPPTVYRDIVIVGNAVPDHLIHPRDPPGDVQAFDARTGRRLWKWDPVPAPGEPGAETWDAAGRDWSGHVNVWAPMTVDSGRGLLYLGVSTPSNDWYGGRRPGDNLHAESLVCLDARTGRLVWYRQLVHHGLWDYDPAAPPNLVTVERQGRRQDIVALPGKTGFLYAFDRVTGEPLWPIEERAVPSSDVPGERASPTQPFVTWPPPFARQGITEDDLVDFTPELRRMALDRVKGLRLGPIFTPPSLEGTLVMPGWIGGAGWGGGAVDPEAGVIYIKATNMPTLGRLVPADSMRHGPDAGYTIDLRPGARPELRVVMPGRRSRRPPFRRGEVYLPVSRPPYGTLTAIELSTGRHRWQVPVGDRPEIRFHRDLRHLNLPPLGVAGPAGGVVTAAGLIFITGGGRTLLAIDARDGAVRWQAELPHPSMANPMTYRTAGGTQVVVVASGWGTRSRLHAFAIPR